MLIWTIIMVVFVLLMILSIVFIFMIKPFGNNVINFDRDKPSFIKNKNYKDFNLDIYTQPSDFIDKYLIYKKNNKKYLLIKYLNNDYYFYYIFIYTDKKNKVKFIKDRRSIGHSKLIRIPNNTSYVMIYDERKILSRQNTPKHKLLLTSFLYSLVLASILIIIKYLFLMIEINNYYSDYSSTLINLITNISLIVIPFIFFIVLLILLMLKDKRRMEEC